MYKIYNKEFKTKQQIKDYCHQTLLKYSDHDELDDDDLGFIKELMTFHPHKYDIPKVVSIQVVHKPKYQELVLNIRKLKSGRKTMYEIRRERTSVKQSITNIPVVVDYVFSFGKYKGKSINEINDDGYIRYLLEVWTDMSMPLRTRFNNYLRGKKKQLIDKIRGNIQYDSSNYSNWYHPNPNNNPMGKRNG